MTARTRRRPPPPLDEQRLEALALRYVERFATTRAKLRGYLERKLRERGWDAPQPPDAERIAQAFAERGYVDDAAYALAKSRALTGRGYGQRRVADALRVAGVEEANAEEARQHAVDEAAVAAVRFAQRRRIGPFAAVACTDPALRQKALGALVRAGHDFALARAIVGMEPLPGADPQTVAQRLQECL